MNYCDIDKKLQEIKTEKSSDYMMSKSNFLNLDLVEKLLQNALQISEIRLSDILVESKPDLKEGWLEGIAESVRFFDEEFKNVRIRFSFLEKTNEFIKKQQLCAELIIKTREIYCPFKGIGNKFSFSQLFYCFHSTEGEKLVFAEAYGKISISEQQIPVRMLFMMDDSFVTITMDEEASSTESLKLSSVFELLGIKGMESVLPEELLKLLELVKISGFDLEYEEEEKQIKRFSVKVAPTTSGIWEIGKVFSVELKEIVLEVSNREGFSTSLTGKMQLNKMDIPVQLGFHSEQKDMYIILGGEEPAVLGSLSDLAGLIGNVDVSAYPLKTSQFYLDELHIGYSMEQNTVSDFSLFLSIHEVWNLWDLFQIEQVSFGIHKKEAGCTYALYGQFMLAEASIFIEAEYDVSWHLYGYTLSEQPISITSLIKQFTGSDITLPDFWLSDIRVTIEPGQSFCKVTGTAGITREKPGFFQGIAAEFAIQKEADKMCCAIRLNGAFDFSELPFVGGNAEELDGVAMGGMIFFYTNQPVSDFSAEGVAEHVTAETGLTFFIEITLPDGTKRFALPLHTDGEHTQLVERDGTGVGFSGQAEINKTIGPFIFRQLLFSYENDAIGLGLNAAFQAGGLALDLDELAFSYGIKDRNVAVSLAGLSLAVTQKGFSLQGGFIREKEKERYSGSLTMQAGTYGVTAYGAYEAAPFPSAFLFGMLKGNLGGPPCFMLTGIAAGFGYSRTLCIPEIEKLENFSLMAAVKGKKSATEVQQNADRDFPAKAGSNWIAAGITANSFQMANMAVLATVLIEQNIKVSLLGSADISIPRGAAVPVAKAGLFIKISIDPESGLIPVDGILASDSYILSKDCHLSGGFAFYLWYGGEHAGDFVISLGGYRNGYQKPQHYPSPNRLKMSWRLSNELSAEGSLYFALTPSCMMAGGDFQMVFDWKCVHAWFHAYTDILIGWKPYTYAFNIGIHIGVKVNLKLFKVNLELGCDLAVWGPDFSGNADIHLWIISFSIRFGNGKKSNPTISIEEFKSSFLPEAKKQAQQDGETAYGGISICFLDGKISEYKKAEETDTKSRIVNGQQLKLEVKSVLPAVTVKLNGTEIAYEEKEKIYLRPCGIETETELIVEIKRCDGVSILAELVAELIMEQVPAALWEKKEASVETKKRCTGLTAFIKQDHKYRTLDVEISCSRDEKKVGLVNPASLVCKEYDQTQAYERLQEINSDTVAQKRKAFLRGLPEKLTEQIDLASFQNPKELFYAAPYLTGTGGSCNG